MPLVRWLYLVNLAVLAAHEVDSAYWHEWTLFGLPGGIQLFVLLNLVAFLFFFHGLVLVVEGRRSGLWFSLGLAGAGIFATAIHSIFLGLGHDEFRTPISLALLTATGLLSLAQAAATVRALRGAGPG